MAKLTSVSWFVLIRRLRSFGFQGPFQGGKHPYMVKKDLVLTVPNPHRGEIGVPLLVRILRQAGISRKQWVERS